MRPHWSTVRTVVANGGSRLAIALTPFVTTPIVARSLDPEAYGAYVVVAATAALLPMAELGVSLALVPLLGRLRSEEADAGLRYIASAFFFLQAVAATVLVGAVLAGWSLDLPSLLGVGSAVATGELQISFTIAMACVAAGLPAHLVHKTALGVGRTTAPALWQLFSMPFVISGAVSVALTGGGLTWFIVAIYVPPAAAAIVVSVWQFSRTHAVHRPRAKHASLGALRELLSAGLGFTVAAIATASVVQSAPLVLSHLVGTVEAAEYGLAYRVSSVAVILAQGLSLPLWPAFGKALQAEGASAAALLRTSTLAAAGSGAVFALTYVLAGQPLIRLWVGEAYVPETSVVLPLGLLALLQSALLPANVLLASLRATRFIVVTSACMAASTLLASLLLTGAVGVPGPAWAAVLGVSLCSVIPTAWYLPHVLTRSRGAASNQDLTDAKSTEGSPRKVQ